MRPENSTSPSSSFDDRDETAKLSNSVIGGRRKSTTGGILKDAHGLRSPQTSKEVIVVKPETITSTQTLKKGPSYFDLFRKVASSKVSTTTETFVDEENTKNISPNDENSNTGKKMGKFAMLSKVITKNKKDFTAMKIRHRYFKRQEFPNGDMYEGEWYDDMKDGFGKYSWNAQGLGKGDSYEGQWEMDKRHGDGIMVFFESGEEYTGQFKDDLMHGVGVLKSLDVKNDIYSGTWLEGERDGKFHVCYDGWLEMDCTYKQNIIIDYKFRDDDISFEQFDQIPFDIRKACLWTDSSSYSIYTFCIFTMLQFDQFPTVYDKWKVLIIYLQANTITAFAQAYILWQLWFSRPKIRDSLFCSSSGTDPTLYMAILIVFVTQKLSKFKDVRRDLYTVIFGRRFYSGDTQKIRNITTPGWCRAVAIIIALYEVAVWLSVLMIGAYYIITTSGVGSVVQAAVSISYITDIDSMAMMYLPLVLRSNTTTFYEVPKMSNSYSQFGLDRFEARRFLAFPWFFVITITAFFAFVYLSNCTTLIFHESVSLSGS